MDKTLTMALVILCSAIVVFFSKEFSGSFKKIFAIRGMKIFLPLILASWFVAYYDSLLLMGLNSLQRALVTLLKHLAGFLPLPWLTEGLAELILLILIPVLPIVPIEVWYRKKKYKSFEHVTVSVVLIWLTMGIVLVTAPF